MDEGVIRLHRGIFAVDMEGKNLTEVRLVGRGTHVPVSGLVVPVLGLDTRLVPGCRALRILELIITSLRDVWVFLHAHRAGARSSAKEYG